MSETHHLHLVPLTKIELPFLYEKFKEGLYDVSEKAFGWEESFQYERFMKAYRPEWFYFIEDGSKRIGYVCFQSEKQELHLHLLIIFKEFQSKGFGKSAMAIIEKMARDKKLSITLSTLKNNTQAVELYKKLGYTIYNQDEYFYEMRLET